MFPSREERLLYARAAGRTSHSAPARPPLSPKSKSGAPPRRASGRLLMSTAIRVSAELPTWRAG